jgi:hypothetical protein
VLKSQTALEDLKAEVDVNSSWKTFKENITILAKESIGCYEMMEHKQWLDEAS